MIKQEGLYQNKVTSSLASTSVKWPITMCLQCAENLQKTYWDWSLQYNQK